METPQVNPKQLSIIIPLSNNLGQSEEAAIQISGVRFTQVIPIQNHIINYFMDETPWTKLEQSLIITDSRKIDKIGIGALQDDGSVKKFIFCFDISDTFNR